MDKEHYGKLTQEVSPLGRIFRSLLSQTCRNLKLPSIQWCVDAEKWFGLLPIHPWMFRMKHRTDTAEEMGSLLLTLSLPVPEESKFPSQSQESWLARGWAGEKRGGRNGEQEGRLTLPAMCSCCLEWGRGHQGETGVINRLKWWIRRRGKWEQVQQNPVRCESKGVKKPQRWQEERT